MRGLNVSLNSLELIMPTDRFELTPHPKSTLTLYIPFYQLGGSSDDIVWMSRNPVTGALLYQKSGPTYDITHGDINKRISVVTKYTDGSGNLHLKSSADTQQVQPPVYTALTNANF